MRKMNHCLLYSFEDALYLLYERGKAMQEAVPVGKGAMIAVLGSKIEDLKKLIIEAKIDGVCEIANDNAEGQIILSGDISSINSLKNILKDNKKKIYFFERKCPFSLFINEASSNIYGR